MRVKKGFPSAGDVVACTVKSVSSYAAFASLDEYDNLEGLIHISEISTKWVKNIRDHVKEGRKNVCKVLSVDSRKGHINLSLRRITSAQEKTKLEEVSQANKAEKLLEMVAKEKGIDLEKALDIIASPLETQYGALYYALEDSVDKGETVFTDVGISADWAKALVEVAKRNIIPPTVTISGVLTLSSEKPTGLEDIKKALLEAEKATKENESQGEVVVIAAPRYRIKITAPDYKVAESTLKQAYEKAINIVTKAGGSGAFQRK